jgi:hypothetical protein
LPKLPIFKMPSRNKPTSILPKKRAAFCIKSHLTPQSLRPIHWTTPKGVN